MQRASQNTKQRGFTLIEALITALVMAVGLLGLAGLQIAGMKSNRSAYLRSQVTIASYDLIDRMRANPGDFVPDGAGRGKKTFDGCDANPNTSFEQWECVVALLGLPDPSDDDGDKAFVDCEAGNTCNTGNCEIVIRWDDSRGERVPPAEPEPEPEPVRDATTMTFRVCARLPEPV